MIEELKVLNRMPELAAGSCIDDHGIADYLRISRSRPVCGEPVNVRPPSMVVHFLYTPFSGGCQSVPPSPPSLQPPALLLEWLDTLKTGDSDTSSSELPTLNSRPISWPARQASPHQAMILPPSQKVSRISRELSKKPHRLQSAVEAAAQVKEHLSEAKQEILRTGRTKVSS